MEEIAAATLAGIVEEINMYEVKADIEAPLDKQHPQIMKGHAHLVIRIKSGLFLTKQEAYDRANDLAKMAEQDPYFKSYEILDETL